MRLHYHPMSTNARRVLMTAQHLGISLELVHVDLSKAEQNSPQFLKLNPNQRVPVLEHDGFVLWESYAIMQYLADMTSDQTLYAVDPMTRADINRWLFWCGQHFMPGVAILNWENSIKTMIGAGAADPAQVKLGESLFRDAATILDAHLVNSEWICQSGLSLADFAISAPLADTDSAKLPLEGLKNLQRWFSQVKSLEAWTGTES